jgi:hypothetical protein
MATLTVVCTGAIEHPDTGLPWIVPEEYGPRVGQPRYPTCGRPITVDIPDGDPGLSHTWDVKVDARGNVVSRHKNVECPQCGSFTFIVEGVE